MWIVGSKFKEWLTEVEEEQKKLLGVWDNDDSMGKKENERKQKDRRGKCRVLYGTGRLAREDHPGIEQEAEAEGKGD